MKNFLLKSNLLICFLLVSIGMYAQPAYDDCANALTVVINETPINCGGGTPYTNVGSSAEPGETTASCYFSGLAVTRTVWFQFTVPAGCNEVDVRTDPSYAGGMTDSQIAIYDGCNGNEIACDEDGGFSGNNSFINGVLLAGGTYLVQVSGYNGKQGDFCLRIDSSPLAQPCNDDVCKAFDITANIDGAIVNGDNTGATVQSNEPLPPFTGQCNAQYGWCGTSHALNNTVWYSFVAPASGSIDIDFTNTNDMGTALYSGINPCASNPFANAILEAANEDASANPTGAPRLVNKTCLTPGETYYLMVDGYNDGDQGAFTITLTNPSLVCPINNDCADALDISDMEAYNFDTSNADGTQNITSDCGGFSDDDLWFSLTTDNEGTDLTLTVTGSGSIAYDLFLGSCGALNQVGTCNQSSFSSADGIASNTTYYVRVYDSAIGFTGGAEERAITGGTIQAGGSALPADLISFTGTAMNKYNTLKWKTALEQNTSEFAIERSLDGRNNWEVIGTERAAGNSDETITYSFDDMRPATQAYYRLNTIDLDGSAQVSTIVSIKRAAGDLDVVLVAPNPTTSKAVVTFESAKEANVNAIVTDITGKVISTLTQDAIRGLNNMTIDLSNAPSGVYFLTMNNGVNNITRRIVKN